MADINIDIALKNLEKIGYLDLPIPSSLNVTEEIKKIKKRKMQ